MVRRPAVSGIFYEKDFELLEKQIKGCFDNNFPKEKRNERIKGAIVPHAGLIYSGKVAASVYKEIAESKDVETFIIIGPNHTGLGYNSVLMDNMLTPFGEVKLDVELAKEIVENTSLVGDSLSHLKEHSIEVQIPFLQFLFKDFNIIPIIVSSCDYEKIAEGIRKSILKLKKNVCIIASSDFIHHGKAYGFNLFEKDISKNVKLLDKKAINFIKNFDIKGFFNFLNETKASICGVFPIAILLSVLKEGEVIVKEHYTSTDISKDERFCVDYIGALIK